MEDLEALFILQYRIIFFDNFIPVFQFLNHFPKSIWYFVNSFVKSPNTECNIEQVIINCALNQHELRGSGLEKKCLPSMGNFNNPTTF